VTATIDPRIRERRIEVKREAGRKRLRAMLIVLCIVLTLGTAYLIVESPMLDVDHVRITGLTHLQPADVQRAAGVDLGSPLLRVETGKVQARVEQLPWVEHSDVSLRVPGTLRIAIQERVPVAYARRDPSHAVLLDATGLVLANFDTRIDGLIEIRGMRRVPAIGRRLAPANAPGVVARLPQGLAARVGAVDIARGVTLVLSSGGEVRLCTPEDVTAKGAAAEAVMAQLGDQRFTYIDVCVPSAPVSR
jgi:cell division protein FtsQ